MKKKSYDIETKLAVCDYYRRTGHSQATIAGCATFAKYGLSKSNVRDFVKGESKWRAHKAKTKGNSSKKKVHKGRPAKYASVEEALWSEQKRRKKHGLDVSRGWAKTRAAQMYHEWKVLKMESFVPREIEFVRSLKYDAMLTLSGSVRRVHCWNDDEVPLVLEGKRKQIVEEEHKSEHQSVKPLSTTRDTTKRFACVFCNQPSNSHNVNQTGSRR